MDRNLTKLLAVCARELDSLDADWAVGGAIAMATHGYVRETRDVDLFIGDDVREELLDRLAARGLAPEEQFPEVHYALIPSREAADVRVDLLFPASAPETLAIMAARRANVEGVNVPVWPLEHIVAAKFVVDPDIDPGRVSRDRRDLEELRQRGMIDRERVERVLEDCDRDALDRFREYLRAQRRHRER